eukprot:COSAG06_NODE_25914_length_626_cov_0.829222_1_plen_158_part_10
MINPYPPAGSTQLPPLLKLPQQGTTDQFGVSWTSTGGRVSSGSKRESLGSCCGSRTRHVRLSTEIFRHSVRQTTCSHTPSRSVQVDKLAAHDAVIEPRYCGEGHWTVLRCIPSDTPSKVSVWRKYSLHSRAMRPPPSIVLHVLGSAPGSSDSARPSNG